MNKLDMIKSVAMFLVIVLTVMNKMPDFLGRKQSAQKSKSYNDEIAHMGGEVIGVRETDHRTYMQVRPKNGSEFWLSTREMKIEIGEQISFEYSVPRYDYYSAELGRNFSEIYIVPYLNRIKKDDEPLA